MDVAVKEVSQSTRRLHTVKAEAIVKVYGAMKNEGFSALRGMGNDARTRLMMSFIAEITMKPVTKSTNFKALFEQAFEIALVVVEEAKKWPSSVDGFMVEYTIFAQGKPTASEQIKENFRRAELAKKYPGLTAWWFAEDDYAKSL